MGSVIIIVIIFFHGLIPHHEALVGCGWWQPHHHPHHHPHHIVYPMKHPWVVDAVTTTTTTSSISLSSSSSSSASVVSTIPSSVFEMVLHQSTNVVLDITNIQVIQTAMTDTLLQAASSLSSSLLVYVAELEVILLGYAHAHTVVVNANNDTNNMTMTTTTTTNIIDMISTNIDFYVIVTTVLLEDSNNNNSSNSNSNNAVDETISSINVHDQIDEWIVTSFSNDNSSTGKSFFFTALDASDEPALLTITDMTVQLLPEDLIMNDDGTGTDDFISLSNNNGYNNNNDNNDNSTDTNNNDNENINNNNDDDDDHDDKLSILDIVLIVMSGIIALGILYMILRHHLDQGFMENQRMISVQYDAPRDNAESINAAAIRNNYRRRHHHDHPNESHSVPSVNEFDITSSNISDNNSNNNIITIKSTFNPSNIVVVDENDDDANNKQDEIDQAHSTTNPSTPTTVTDSDSDNRVMNAVTPDRSNHTIHHENTRNQMTPNKATDIVSHQHTTSPIINKIPMSPKDQGTGSSSSSSIISSSVKSMSPHHQQKISIVDVDHPVIQNRSLAEKFESNVFQVLKPGTPTFIGKENFSVGDQLFHDEKSEIVDDRLKSIASLKRHDVIHGSDKGNEEKTDCNDDEDSSSGCSISTGTSSGLMKSSNCSSSGNSSTSSSSSSSSSSSRSNNSSNNDDKSSTDGSSIDVFHVDVEAASRRSAASSSEHGHNNFAKEIDTTGVTSLNSSHDSLSSSKANVSEWMKTICVVPTIAAMGSSHNHNMKFPSLSLSNVPTTIVGNVSSDVGPNSFTHSLLLPSSMVIDNTTTASSSGNDMIPGEDIQSLDHRSLDGSMASSNEFNQGRDSVEDVTPVVIGNE
jgi:hypothetical protein